MPNTREKLIELLMQCVPNNLTPQISGNQLTIDIAQGNIADHLIANGVTVQQWIPVTERLPEKNGEYLCRWINKSVSDAEYESTYGSFGYWFDFWEDEYKEWISYEGITHWMPLPEPPKGE